tara:strand:+ start:4717 stop:4929 length:213 start_codon:yes stop_codon:yes gene_type:complete
MNKGYIFNLQQLENGFIITLFSLFKFGVLRGDDGFGPYKSILLGIYRLELVISLAWKPSIEITITEKGYS